MKSKDYWRERFELLEDTLHKDVENCIPEIDKIYRMAQRDIEKDILRWYRRLAKNNEVSMAEARKLLSAGELEEFRWTLEEYIKHGKENAIDQRWVKQLENASAKYHVSKLEALKLQVQQSLELVYGNQLDMLDEQMRRQYQEGYYRTAFEVQKGFSVGIPLASIDQNILDKLIKKPWAPDGRNFSDRVWQNKAKLVSEIHMEITRMCITGAAPDDAIRNIAKKMNTGRYNAGRLVMTEAAYFSSVAEKDSFSDLGVEQYEILATLDSHTSAICQEMDGKVFDMKDYEAGVTAPPFHVWCRSTTVPYFNDEFTAGEMRAARGADGKTYYVPSDMKYKEWKKQFTGGGEPKTGEKLAKSLRADEKFQNRAAQRSEEWKKRHASFDRESAKLEINTIRSQVEDIQKQISESYEKGKILEKKVYFDGTGSDEDMAKLKTLVDSRKKSQESLSTLKEKLFTKQEIYKTEAENRIVKAGIVEEIKLSRKMTPETVDALEDTLKRMKDKYEIMPKGIVYNPIKVPDATASYNWIDDKIYISNRFNDIEKYAETVKASEASLKEYRERSKIIDIQKERLKNAEKILSDKSIKGYEREKAILAKAEAEIELNIQRMAVREDLMDVFTHEYGHFIHRHAETDYIQKSKVFQAKELGGKLINRDWKYDINTRYSAKAKIDAAKISKYATENPYETFAEGFLAMDKGETIPDNIAKVINEAKIKAGVKNVAESGAGDIINIGRNKLKRGQFPVTQSQIDKLIDNELSGVNFSTAPKYNARIASMGKTTMEFYVWGDFKGVKKIEIGKQAKDTKETLLDTLLHEELEVRMMKRLGANGLQEIGDDEIHARIDKTIERFFRIKGWNYDMV